MHGLVEAREAAEGAGTGARVVDNTVGAPVGMSVIPVGVLDGRGVGASVGERVGHRVGALVGTFDIP